MNAFELTLQYAETYQHVADKFLSAAFRDTFEANNIAVDTGLTCDSFCCQAHRWMFSTICEAAQREKYTLSLTELEYMNKLAGSPYPDYPKPVTPLDRLFNYEIVTSGLSVWARKVKALETVRDDVRAMQRKSEGMLSECVMV